MNSIRKKQATDFSPKQRALKTALPQTLAENRHKSLEFSQKIDYGLFLLIELAKHSSQTPLSLRTIADEHHMSFFFLQKVAYELRRAGFIKALRGKSGGYILKKPADQLDIKTIVEVLEGPIALTRCADNHPQTETCLRQATCSLRSGIGTLNQILISIFTKTTLTHLLDPSWSPHV